MPTKISPLSSSKMSHHREDRRNLMSRIRWPTYGQCIPRQRHNAAAIWRESSPAIRNQYGVYRWCVSTEGGPSLPYNWLPRQVLGETTVVVLQRTKTILSIPGNCLAVLKRGTEIHRNCISRYYISLFERMSIYGLKRAVSSINKINLYDNKYLLLSIKLGDAFEHDVICWIRFCTIMIYREL